jgi:hypothetical protein
MPRNYVKYVCFFDLGYRLLRKEFRNLPDLYAYSSRENGGFPPIGVLGKTKGQDWYILQLVQGKRRWLVRR